MQRKNQNARILSEYTAPELTVLLLGKEDVVTTSPIYLPMQPLGDDPQNDGGQLPIVDFSGV